MWTRFIDFILRTFYHWTTLTSKNIISFFFQKQTLISNLSICPSVNKKYIIKCELRPLGIWESWGFHKKNKKTMRLDHKTTYLLGASWHIRPSQIVLCYVIFALLSFFLRGPRSVPRNSRCLGLVLKCGRWAFIFFAVSRH